MSPQDLVSQLGHYAGAAQQAANIAPTSEDTSYHVGAMKAYRHAAGLVGDLVPRWTKETPTKVGVYWWLPSFRDATKELVQVEMDFVTRTLRARHIAGVPTSSVAGIGGQWSGQIPTPLDP